MHPGGWAHLRYAHPARFDAGEQAGHVGRADHSLTSSARDSSAFATIATRLAFIARSVGVSFASMSHKTHVGFLSASRPILMRPCTRHTRGSAYDGAECRCAW